MQYKWEHSDSGIIMDTQFIVKPPKRILISFTSIFRVDYTTPLTTKQKTWSQFVD